MAPTKRLVWDLLSIERMSDIPQVSYVHCELFVSIHNDVIDVATIRFKGRYIVRGLSPCALTGNTSLVTRTTEEVCFECSKLAVFSLLCWMHQLSYQGKVIPSQNELELDAQLYGRKLCVSQICVCSLFCFDTLVQSMRHSSSRFPLKQRLMDDSH